MGIFLNQNPMNGCFYWFPTFGFGEIGQNGYFGAKIDTFRKDFFRTLSKNEKLNLK